MDTISITLTRKSFRKVIKEKLKSQVESPEISVSYIKGIIDYIAKVLEKINILIMDFMSPNTISRMPDFMIDDVNPTL